MEIGKDGTEPGKILSVVITAVNLWAIRVVTDIIRRVHLLNGSKVFLGYCFQAATRDYLVLFY
jgi:hypothetical protein